jgi:hypothetical protein
MTRSRMVVSASSLVVSLGLVGALGMFYLDPARAAVGPLPAEGLSLPSDSRFVMGLDVRRFVASPFYEKFGKTQGEGRPNAFAELEAKTGLNPERDIDHIYVAGSGPGQRGGDGVVLVVGRFDRYKIGRLIETEKKSATSKKYQGLPMYLFNEAREGRSGSGALAFLDDDSLVIGSQAAVEKTIASRVNGDGGLRGNQPLTALLESVRPGSTFWVVGDQSVLDQMPRSVPGPGGAGGMNLPGLKSVVVTGDLDPLVSLDVTGEAVDEAGARNLADLVRGMIALANLQAGQNPGLKELASAVSVSTEASRVRITGRFDYEALDSLRQQHMPKRPRKAEAQVSPSE